MAVAAISILCFLCIIAITVVLLIRDNYIKKDCEARLEDVANKINEVNMFKYNADKSQYTRIADLEDSINSVQKDYVRRDDMIKGVTTDSLKATNIKTEYVRIKDAEIEGSLHSDNFGMVDPNSKGTRQECAATSTLEKFFNRPVIETFAAAQSQAPGFDLSTENGISLDKLDVIDFTSGKAKIGYAKIDDGSFKTFSAGKATFDTIGSKGGVFDNLDVGSLNAKEGTMNNMVVNNSTLNNAKLLNSTSDKLYVNALTTDTQSSKTIDTKKLTSDTGTIDFLKSTTGNFGTVVAANASIDSLVTKELKPESITSKAITTDSIKSGVADFEGVTSKNITTDDINSGQGTFNTLNAGVARVTGKISTSDQVCVNNACLDSSMIQKILKNPPGSISNDGFFKGGLSELNPQNQGTRFPDVDGMNYIRGTRL